MDLEIVFPLNSSGFGMGARVLQAVENKTNITKVEIRFETDVLGMLKGVIVIIRTALLK
ncbi:hypothetical protein [Aquiflexum sp.]|uniref:hypothetical protein n=1 Tax=Aquiflexum sp. TaxID=1872584 RepID=UPI003593BC3D